MYRCSTVASKKSLLLLVAVVVVVSGCSQLPSSGPSTSSEEPEQISGKGLEVTQFRVSDKTLSPGQEVEVNLQLKNYHQQDIEIGNVSLYNLGLLESSDKSCYPNEIDPAQDGIYPVMECSWKVKAPSSELVGGFEQRKSSISVNIPYNSTIENVQPMKVEFKPLEQINRTDRKSMSFSNGEVAVNTEVESPIPLGQDKSINFEVSKAGDGRLEGGYGFEYSPSSLFEIGDGAGECPSSDEPVLDDSLSFSCNINAEGSSIVERNLFFTVSYKYIQAPSIDITIVN